jgi:hypothetical protein
MESIVKGMQFVDIRELPHFDDEKVKKVSSSMWFTVGVMMEKTIKTSSSGIFFVCLL